MIQLSQFYQWIEKRSNLFVDLVRIYLGIGLFVRGILFSDSPVLLSESLLSAGQYSDGASFMMHLVAMIHVGGGLLLAVGLATRIAALIQIPILFVAVFFVHFPEGLMTSGQSLEFSALVLFLLILPPEGARGAAPAIEPVRSTGTCSCGHDKDHHMVIAKPTYRKSGWIALFLGVRALPIMITYTCRTCGEVIARTRDPETLARYR